MKNKTRSLEFKEAAKCTCKGLAALAVTGLLVSYFNDTDKLYHKNDVTTQNAAPLNFLKTTSNVAYSNY